MSSGIYHERQSLQLCALHSLNNLFQGVHYTKAQLDELCMQLNKSNWMNPHRSMLGLGNYDINVIISALSLKGYETVWFDKRRDLECLKFDDIFGLILNLPSNYKLGFIPLPLEMRHWLAIRNIGLTYYNLDSKLTQPQVIGDETELIKLLRQQLQTNDCEIFLVMPKKDNTQEQNAISNITEEQA